MLIRQMIKILIHCPAIGVLLLAVVAADPPNNEARVTRIIREVNLLPSDAPPRAAAEDDQVNENTAVRTGNESRSELTFDDSTITRLGANTIFSFNRAGHSGHLGGGSMLVYVPKNSGGGEFRTNAVTVGVTGTTFIFESTLMGNGTFIVLEGGARLGLVKHPGQFRNVRAGQILAFKAGATKLPAPVNVDLNQIMRTHPLITDFPPLPSLDLILAVIDGRQEPISRRPPGAPRRPIVTNVPMPPSPGTGIVMPTPPPRPIFTPTQFPTRTPPPQPTPTPPKVTSTPTPKPTATPKGTPRPSPRPTRYPGKGQFPRPIKPPKKGTPTPSPSPKIF
jgi:hypothetical protein